MKAVVLHSGGLDSTVCLLLAKEAKRDVLSLGIDYGQRHRIEMEYAAGQCSRFDIARRVLRVEWDKPLRNVPLNRSLEDMRSVVSTAFLPGRNALFLTLACAEAAGIEAGEVWVGINSIDFSGYPDCKPEFLDSFTRMIVDAIPNGPKVVAPLMARTKLEIAREAQRLGLRRADTWSCYRPQLTHVGLVPCRECDACVLHDHAWNELARGEGRGA